ncbi:MAG TPA: hypothetical protein VLX12_11555 [Syntrophorhabdales bacterium]|nr:hypothetical protein [Syntrophorhabdales bacterium]
MPDWIQEESEALKPWRTEVAAAARLSLNRFDFMGRPRRQRGADEGVLRYVEESDAATTKAYT